MKDMGIVYGDTQQAAPLIIGFDTVYVHTDIERLEPDENGIDRGFHYREIQYGKDEYIKLMAEKNESAERQLTSLQLALCEVYEMIGG